MFPEPRLGAGMAPPLFVTATIIDWIPVFLEKSFCELLISSFRYCQQRKGLLVHGYVIMPNHFHLVGSRTGRDDVETIIQNIKSFTAHEILKLLQRRPHASYLELLKRAAMRERPLQDHMVWRSDNIPFGIVTRTTMRQKLNYIHSNPVRKGLVRRAEDWYYSSAAAYHYGDHRPLVVDLIR